jgi:hypothetical protein
LTFFWVNRTISALIALLTVVDGKSNDGLLFPKKQQRCVMSLDDGKILQETSEKERRPWHAPELFSEDLAGAAGHNSHDSDNFGNTQSAS